MSWALQLLLMASSTFQILFLISSLLTTLAFEPKLSITKCNEDTFQIRYPFWELNQQPQHNHNSPSFQLFCEENATTIHFPSYGKLVVKSINYDIKKLDLLDPNNCVHEVFLNLNLSFTPFQYYYTLKNYSYLNCSTRLLLPLQEVPCLSGSSHHVYTVDSYLGIPASCRKVKTVAIPLAYSPYLYDNSIGLGFTWSLPLVEKTIELKEASFDLV